MPTKSEISFENFSINNSITCSRLPEGVKKTADYRIGSPFFDDVIVEIKQIDHSKFLKKCDNGVFIGDVGKKIRSRIRDGRRNLKGYSGEKTLIVIYNNFDDLDLFGTDPYDFSCAMYGDMTIHINMVTGQRTHKFGENACFNKMVLSNVSGIGHLRKNIGQLDVYINAYAKNPIDIFGMSLVPNINIYIFVPVYMFEHNWVKFGGLIE